MPLVDLFARNPAPIFIAAFGSISLFAFQNLAAAFAIQYAITTGGYVRSDVLLAFSIASFLQIFATGAFAKLSDRVGRRPVMLFGNIVGLILVYPIFLLMGYKSILLLTLAMILFTAVAQAAMAGPAPAYISEMFGTTGRYTGASLGYQIASTLGGGLTPLVAATIMPSYGIVGVCGYMGAILTISTVVLLLSKETSNRELRG